MNEPAGQLKYFCAWIEEHSLDQDKKAFFQLLYPFVLGVFIIQNDSESALNTLKGIPTLKPLRGLLSKACAAIKQKKLQPPPLNETIPVAIPRRVLKDMQVFFTSKKLSFLSYILATLFDVTMIESPSSECPDGVHNLDIFEIESRHLLQDTPRKKPKLDLSTTTTPVMSQETEQQNVNDGDSKDNQQQNEQQLLTEPKEGLNSEKEPKEGLNDEKEHKDEKEVLSSVFDGMSAFGTKMEETQGMKEDRKFMVSLGTIIESTDSVKGLPSVCFSTFYGCKTALKTAVFSPNGEYLAGGFGNSLVRVWPMVSAHTIYGENSAAVLTGHAGPVYALAFSYDSSLLASASGDSTVRVWERADSKYRYVATLSGHIIGDPLWAVTFSPNGAFLASASHDKTVCIWDMATLPLKKNASAATVEQKLTAEAPTPARVFIGHKSDVTALCFHPLVDLIASGSTDRTVRVWNYGKGKCWRLFLGHEAEITCVKFSPNGKFLASADTRGVINVWSMERGTRVKTFALHKGVVFALDFSMEGSILVSGGTDNTIRIWNAHDEYLEGPDDGRKGLLHMYLTKETPVFQVMFTRRNLLLAAGHSQDNE